MSFLILAIYLKQSVSFLSLHIFYCKRYETSSSLSCIKRVPSNIITRAETIIVVLSFQKN